MAELRVYSTDSNHPLSRCQSESTWEERCVKYAEHVKSDEQGPDHVDGRGYSWTVPKLTAPAVARAFGVPAAMVGSEVQEEALRELLSYCRSEEERLRPLEVKIVGGADIFKDVAERLAKILDGEN